ncbi:M13 family metallopeptidase [Luteococcus sanguinis]|uniref:M13 family metallopeptidase n=1 Tax=Luteococcus sanguinis TaxID=174038 RepID=A0ABW1WZ68_9ACTN
MDPIDQSSFDPTVRPQDDFYRHVHGPWLETAQIQEDRASAGAFVHLRDEAEVAVREIIESLTADADGEQGKVAALYRDFMDEETVERLGAAPLRPLLDRVDAIDSRQALARHWGWSLRHGIGSLVAAGAEVDPGNPKRSVLFVLQAGLGLPDEVYYRDGQHAEVLKAYAGHVERSLALAGVADAAEQARLVVDLETRIALHHWDRVRCRDLHSMYNLMGWESFRDSAPGLLLDEVLAGAEIAPGALSEVVCSQPSFVTGVAELVTDDALPAWRAWARWKAVSSLSSYLSTPFVAERFDFYERTLAGVPQLRARWKRGVALVQGALGEAVGKLYVERHFPPAAKARMDELVSNLLRAYGESISSLDWMGEQTREQALDKLSKFRPKIGYPARWRDYSGLEIVSGDLVGNVLRSNGFDFAQDLTKLTEPVDLEEWLMLPQTVNAYYHPLRNEIVFPAAILQPPFFDPEADDAVNYGGIGAVIGHEIGHGFDDQGSMCDGDGQLRNWWTDDDRATFSDRTGALVAQYEGLVPSQFADAADAPRVNGQLTIGENIGDLGGLGIAIKAWRIATGGTDPEPIAGLTGLQRLLYGYARVWQNKMRDEALRQQVATDPHSPSEFRCNQVVKNIDAFHEAFGTPPGDAEWLAPEERVRIW